MGGRAVHKLSKGYKKVLREFKPHHSMPIEDRFLSYGVHENALAMAAGAQ